MSVGVKMSAEITPESLERFKRAVNSVTSASKKEIGLLINEIGVNFVREAFNVTKLGKRTINAKADDSRKRAWQSQGLLNRENEKLYRGVWLWTWLRSRQGPVLRVPLPASVAKERGLVKIGAYSKGKFAKAEWEGNMQVVRNRGFAKAGWRGILKLLGKNALGFMGGDESDMHADAATARWKFAKAIIQNGTDSASLTISNGVPPAVRFLDNRDNIMARALMHTIKNLERIKRNSAGKIQQSWERARDTA